MLQADAPCCRQMLRHGTQRATRRTTCLRHLHDCKAVLPGLRGQLQAILLVQRFASINQQHAAAYLWHQVLDAGARQGSMQVVVDSQRRQLVAVTTESLQAQQGARSCS